MSTHNLCFEQKYEQFQSFGGEIFYIFEELSKLFFFFFQILTLSVTL